MAPIVIPLPSPIFLNLFNRTRPSTNHLPSIEDAAIIQFPKLPLDIVQSRAIVVVIYG
jgi:hypothetical protein